MVNLNRFNEQLAVSRPLVINLEVDDDLALGFLHLDHFAEFIRFPRLALTNDFRLRFKDTEELAVGMSIAFEYSGFGLLDYLLNAGHHGVYLAAQALQCGLLQDVGGSLYPVGDLFGEAFGLSHYPTHRCQQFAISLLQSFPALRNFGASRPRDVQQ